MLPLCHGGSGCPQSLRAIVIRAAANARAWEFASTLWRGTRGKLGMPSGRSADHTRRLKSAARNSTVTSPCGSAAAPEKRAMGR